MRLRRLAGALVLALSTPAGAGTLATGIVFVGDDPNISCRLINLGPKPVTIRAARVLGNSPGAGTVGVDICSNATLPAEHSCSFAGTTDSAHIAGAADVKGSGKTLRGVCLLSGSSTQLYLEMR